MPELASNPLRPNSLTEFIGQTKLRTILSIAINGAVSRKEPVGHTVFIGPPGLGKTTLAKIIAAETHRPLIVSNGPSITKIQHIKSLVEEFDKSDGVLFIDEIHRLPRVVEETLYPVMEDYRLHITSKKGETFSIGLKPFTLVGATTRLGMLTKPLRDRFVHTYHLDFYSPDELYRVVARSAKIAQILIEPKAIEEIAKRSRKTPRVANNLLLRSRDFALSYKIAQISYPVILGMFELLEIDELGLDRVDQAILNTIAGNFRGGPVGLDALAASLLEEPDVIESVYEPYLLQIGLLIRGSRGRELSLEGYKYLRLATPLNNNGSISDKLENLE